MNAIYALYDDGLAAQRAVDELRAAGVADDDITVITSAPMHDFEFSRIGRPAWPWHIAVAGGLAGLLAVTWLARTAALGWPIVTGNMPIMSWWTNLIVMFEWTMLGAMLATFAAFVRGAGLLRRAPALYDPEVTSGKILVGVEHPRGGTEPEIERALGLRS
jgi:hypothetical protein